MNNSYSMNHEVIKVLDMERVTLQLQGDICDKCGVSGMWIDHDF